MKMVLVGLLPILVATMFTLSQRHRAQEMREELISIQEHLQQHAQRQRGNSALRRRHSGADHFYVDNALESLSLLSFEHEELTRLLEQEPSLPDRELLDRLNGDSRLHFREGAVECFDDLRQTQESLVQPVELDSDDLKELLARIEGPHEGPQLLITDFKLSRKSGYGDNEVFVLDLQFLKREFP